MQTFMPVPSYWGSATLLDRQRLGKQRLENLQIMQALTGLRVDPETGETVPHEPPASVAKHWVTAMWRGYEGALLEYQLNICTEWLGRGYVDNCFTKTFATLRPDLNPVSYDPPPFMGDPEFHRQHRARLVAKDPMIYAEMFPDDGQIWDYDFQWRT